MGQRSFIKSLQIEAVEGTAKFNLLRQRTHRMPALNDLGSASGKSYIIRSLEKFLPKKTAETLSIGYRVEFTKPDFVRD
jgi:hypothetical protein